MRASVFATLLAATLTASVAVAQLQTFTLADTATSLSDFSNANKGVLDPQTSGVTGVAFGAGTFVVVGQTAGDTVIRWATSPDGVVWTPHTQTIADGAKSSSQSKVHYQNNKFIFFAGHALSNGSSATFIYTSTDGLSWTGTKILDGGHQPVEFDSSPTTTVMAGSNGDQYVSNDLVTWTSSPVTGNTGGVYSHNDVTYGAGRFFSFINGFSGTTYTSATGTGWTALATTFATPGGANGEAGNGVVLINIGADYYRSTDGTTFTKVAPSLPNLWFIGGSPRFAGGRFLALSTDLNTGKQGYLGSTDGLTWTPLGYAPPAPTPPSGTTRGYTYIDYAWGNGKYVLVAADTTQTFFTRVVVPAIFTLAAEEGKPGANPSNAAAPSQVAIGGSLTLSTSLSGTLQWQRNGTNISGAVISALPLFNFQPADAGIYTVGSGTSTQFFPVGVSSTAKVVGTGTELSANIAHPNGNIFDQILPSGTALAINCDAGQATRTSFIDLNGDIVQIEFSGAGTLSLVFDSPTGPAAPVNYNQPTVSYMKGHAGIVITGANETTNISVFAVGRATAFDPTGAYNILKAPDATTNVPSRNGSSLFTGKGSTVYDGTADLAFIAITSTNGKFGGIRTANASYFATKGVTGIYAPGIAFTGPVFVGDINATDNAVPVFVIGSSSDTRITGGDLLQTNSQAVRVSGLTQLKFTAGIDANGNALSAKTNKGVLKDKDTNTDVTAQVVVNP